MWWRLAGLRGLPLALRTDCAGIGFAQLVGLLALALR